MVYPIFNNTKPYDGTNAITLTAIISGLAPIDDYVNFDLLSPNYLIFTLGYYGIEPWGTYSNFIDISASWIWPIYNAHIIAPINTFAYQIEHQITNNTINYISVTVHLLSDDICNFYFNGTYIGSSIIGGYNTPSYSKFIINIPVGTSLFEFESYNLGTYDNPAGILVSVIDNYSGIVLLRSDDSWVFAVNATRTNIYNQLITINNDYIATTGQKNGDIIDVIYSNLYLIGPNSSNYYIISSGTTTAIIIALTLVVNFNSLGKVYDRNNNALVTYTISYILPEHQNLVDISSNYIAQYRTYNTGNNIGIDIINISLYGPASDMYTVNNYYYTTGIISQRYIYSTGIDKIYDRDTVAKVSISNIILFDNIYYSANFENKYTDSNKLVIVSISNIINDTINNLTYNLSFYYSFNFDSVIGLSLANMYNSNMHIHIILICIS